MSPRSAVFAMFVLAFVFAVHAADEPPKSNARDRLKARIAADAWKSKGKKPTAPAAAKPTTTPPTAPAPATRPTPLATKETDEPAPNSAAGEKKQTPTVLPKIEVRNDRITVLDQQLAKQDEAIEREKKNLKSSETDDALNDAKLARPFSIFGGNSTQFRKGVASERVELMEAEKDMMEAIAHAKTKEEKALLQKQLDQLKAMRRDLDRAMR